MTLAVKGRTEKVGVRSHLRLSKGDDEETFADVLSEAPVCLIRVRAERLALKLPER